MAVSFAGAAMWPLKSLGFDPGRALANAHPTPEQLRARREEQHAYIAAAIARPSDGTRRAVGGNRSSQFARQRHAN